MDKCQTKGLKHYSNSTLMFGITTASILIMGTVVTIGARASAFAPSENPTSTVAACPANHKMYYVGASAPTSTDTAPVTSQALSWTAGNTTKTFTFSETSGNKTFVISFSSIVDKTTTSISSPANATSPFYDSLSGVTTSALNLVHSSPISTTSKTNHLLDITVNRPTSKTGYKIQDVDSLTTNSLTPYIEQVDVSANSGKLTYVSAYQTINTAGTIVTGKKGLNCSTGGCTIDANWNYTLADIALNLKHNNTLSEVNSPHAVGYSDFYFCLAPPKIIIKTVLNGTRVNSSDQFKVEVTNGTTVVDAVTTTGTTTTVSNGTSAVLTLKDSTSYTIAERILNGGSISNYNASYACTNGSTGSTTVMPTGTASSFTLSNLNYGDEITCTITNSPNYVFSGTVFNDNGGITDAQADATNSTITSGVYSNSNYFNGILNAPTETGISGSTITLVDKCENPTKTYATQTLTSTNASDIGTYQFNIASSVIGTQSSVCLIETYSGTAYPVRTTIDKRTVSLVTNTYSYSSNDFGRVITNNSAIVLEKEQAANTCNITDLTTVTTYSKNALSSSTNGADVQPGQCIAYKITATNRANMDISNFIMQDVLQKNDASNPADTTVTSVLANPTRASGIYSDSLVKGQNGTITTIATVLTKRSARTFYFNTQYGSTQSK